MVQPIGHPVSVDKKMQELNWHIVCINSETKWFRDDVHEVDGFMMLHSGSNIPQSGDVIQLGEGVAI